MCSTTSSRSRRETPGRLPASGSASPLRGGWPGHGRRGVVRTAIPDRCPLLFLLPLRRRAVMGEEDVPEVVDLDATASVELGDDSVVAN